jgi:manganese/zinc/iron transport system permease protein
VGTLIELLPLSYTDAVVVLGAAILGLACGVLGTFAVLRRRALVGDAVAHATLPGVCLAFLLTGAKDAGALIAGAAAVGLLAAVLMVAVERTSRIRPDAAIGVVLCSLFSLGIVLLTAIGNSGDGDQAGLERYLFGQAAGLLERDLTVMLALTVAALAVVALAHRALKVTLFDPAFAGSLGLPVRSLELLMTALLVVAIVVGVRAVGAILMVAMLVVPAVTARQLTNRLGPLLVLAGAVGTAVGVTGALVSERSELPTGPVVVLVGTAVALAALALAPGRGVLWRARRLAADRRAALREAVLVDLAALGGSSSLAALEAAGARRGRGLGRAVRALRGDGLLDGADGALVLTVAGREAAEAALGRRDLWTLWLEHGGKLALPDAREPDPRDLDASLGEEATARLRALGAAA